MASVAFFNRMLAFVYLAFFRLLISTLLLLTCVFTSFPTQQADNWPIEGPPFPSRLKCWFFWGPTFHSRMKSWPFWGPTFHSGMKSWPSWAALGASWGARGRLLSFLDRLGGGRAPKGFQKGTQHGIQNATQNGPESKTKTKTKKYAL